MKLLIYGNDYLIFGSLSFFFSSSMNFIVVFLNANAGAIVSASVYTRDCWKRFSSMGIDDFFDTICL